MKSPAIETTGGTGCLESKEPDLLAYRCRRNAVAHIQPVDAHTSSRCITKHHVDALRANIVDHCSPCVVRDAFYVLGIPTPPLGGRCSVCGTDVSDLTAPASLSRRG